MWTRYKQLYHTIRPLKLTQIWYRFYYFFKPKNILFKPHFQLQEKKEPFHWEGFEILYPNSYKNGKFNFLNMEVSFKEKVDWNFSNHGKLWAYNLNYFDFLNQLEIDKDVALALIEDYVEDSNNLKDGIEPYPISLRGINWIKFLAKNKIEDNYIDLKLYHHYSILRNSLEYHLLGNHLLENAYSMLFGAYYFKDERFYNIAYKILIKELEEQVLSDGAHFELSPMYHQILLHRLLDCVHLIDDNPWKQDKLYSFLVNKAEKMLGWLKAVTYRNGNIPMVNDCAFDIAPTSEQLLEYANYLKIQFYESILKESGYRKFAEKKYELFVDVGNIGPDYQPGHAHSDTFSFELYLEERPFIVDVGTSTYQKDEKRRRERQTFSHNTVMVNNMDQTHVWGGFRVGRRAKITKLKEGPNMVLAAHDGYKPIGIIHERRFNATEKIIICDQVFSKKNKNIESQAFFHIHPSIEGIHIEKNQVTFDGVNALFRFEGQVSRIELKEYEYCMGFNKTETGLKICVTFSKELTTTILL